MRKTGGMAKAMRLHRLCSRAGVKLWARAFLVPTCVGGGGRASRCRDTATFLRRRTGRAWASTARVVRFWPAAREVPVARLPSRCEPPPAAHLFSRRVSRLPREPVHPLRANHEVPLLL